MEVIRGRRLNWTIDDPVSLTNPGDQTNNDGDQVSLQMNASDVLGSTLSYYFSGLPSGLTGDQATGLISGTIASDADQYGPYSVTVSAVDQTHQEQASQTFTWTVAKPVTLTNPGDQSSYVANEVGLVLSASDATGAEVTYSATGLPPGLSVDPYTGFVYGVVDNGADSGSPYTVTATASDGTYSDSQTFAWFIDSNPVSLTNPGDQINAAGDQVSLPMSASDTSGGTLSFFVSGLPDGLTADPTTGLISGTVSSTAYENSPYTTVVTADDGTYSATQTFTWTIEDYDTTVSLLSSLDPSQYTQAVTFTATVAPAPGAVSGTPTGDVAFYDNSGLLGTVALSNGVASLAVSDIPVGDDGVEAGYLGDGTYVGSASDVLTQTVNANNTTVSLTSSLNPSDYSGPVTFTATVAPDSGALSGTPTGDVVFSSNAKQLGTAALSNGVATLTVSTLPAGDSSIVASYLGDSTYAISTSDPLTQTVTSNATVSLTASLNPSQFTQTVTFAVTVAAAPGGPSGTPTGEVDLYDGDAELGSATLSNGLASFDVSGLGAGDHTIYASYLGDGTYDSSVSGALTQTVNANDTTVSLTSPLNPSQYTQAVTLTATVAPSAGALSGTPTGNVTFYSNSGELGTVALSNGVAVLTVDSLDAGADSIVASYFGDSIYSSSASDALVQTVNANDTTVSLTSSANPSQYTQAVTFTATVAAAAGALSGTPTGDVVFYDDTGELGTGTLSNGVATLTVSSIAVGDDNITASYQGDAVYAASNSDALDQTVSENDTTVSLTSSLNPSQYTQAVTFTATVAPATGAVSGTPTGSVVFSDKSGQLGTVALSNGVATLTVSNIASGSDMVTASYLGDATYASSVSDPLTQTINANDTTVSLTSSQNPSQANQAVTFTATVAPTGSALSGTPTGDVAFYDGTTNLGTGALSNGVATFTISGLATGNHTIIAAYQGDSTYASSKRLSGKLSGHKLHEEELFRLS